MNLHGKGEEGVRLCLPDLGLDQDSRPREEMANVRIKTYHWNVMKIGHGIHTYICTRFQSQHSYFWKNAKWSFNYHNSVLYLMGKWAPPNSTLPRRADLRWYRLKSLELTIYHSWGCASERENNILGSSQVILGGPPGTDASWACFACKIWQYHSPRSAAINNTLCNLRLLIQHFGSEHLTMITVSLWGMRVNLALK